MSASRKNLVSLLAAKLLSVALLGMLLIAPDALWAKRPPRFSAKLADGKRLDGEQLTDWHATDAIPKLDDQPLLEPRNPLVWLRDRGLSPAEVPTAYVEMFSGDRLPGVVIGYHGGPFTPPEQSRPYWLVRPQCDLHPPREVPEHPVRIEARFVRRVVWQRRANARYQPSTVFFRGGGSLGFRAARVSAGAVLLLLEQGTRRIEFREIAELHLPQEDFWELYFDELAVLSPNAESRLLQIETNDGLVVTGSMNRFTAFSWGGSKYWDRWAHGLQPVWCNEVLWVPTERIWMRRMFSPQNVPLSRVPPEVPESTADQGRVAVLWPWQVNHDVQGGDLRSGEQDFGWGFGVHAANRMEFSLPPIPVSFSARVGLDQIVGQGGCVRARVYHGSVERGLLYESPFLIGTQNSPSLGPLQLPPSMEEDKRLILDVDPAHQGRPTAADPFNIRDFADWLEPVLHADLGRLKSELRARAPQQISAWDGWQVHADDTAQWTTEFREVPSRPERFVQGVLVKQQPLRISRQHKLDADDRWLLIAVSQERPQTDRPRVEVRLDGELIFSHDVPHRENWRPDADPLVIPLDDYRGDVSQPIDIEIQQLPGPTEVSVAWQGIAIVQHLPMLQVLFEDDGPLRPADGDRNVAAWVTDQPHSGGKAICLPGEASCRLSVPGGPLEIRERPEWGQFRFLQLAVRKQGAGRVGLELEHAESESRPARYDAGLGDPVWPLAKRVWDRQLPEEWTVLTRDLYADFGNLDMDSLTLSVPDGESAWFDGAYLGRRVDDFRYLKDARSVREDAQQAARQAADSILDRTRPACVAIDFGEGRFGTGTIISGEGEVLSAGHLVLGKDRKATVHLADGRTFEAITKGVCRDLDLGLLQFKPDAAVTAVSIHGATLAAEPAYFSLQHPFGFTEAQQPQGSVVGVRRVLEDVVWTDLDGENWSAGGPLLDGQGRLVAVHVARSAFGGHFYSQLREIGAILPRLRGGEVWGSWMTGTAATIGAILTTTVDGCRVVERNTDLEKAGVDLQAGDLFTHVDGQVVLRLIDVADAIGDRDPGQQVEIRFRRGSEDKRVVVTLQPRVP